MTALYTAVGRFQRKKNKDGQQYPVVIVNGEEHMVDIPEMILWTCLNWRILTISQIDELYVQKLREVKGTEYAPCENYVKRLIQRGLIVSGVGNTGAETLYDLLCNLYIVPADSGLFTKIAAFLKFTLRDGVPFYQAKAVFHIEKLSGDEKRIMDLAKQAQLSTAEIIKCVETGVYDLSSEEKIMNALYDDDFTTSDNIGYYAELSSKQRPVLVAVSNLYLRKLIIFERI